MRIREKKLRLELDSQERSVVLRSLVDMKNRMIEQGRYTDCVDEMIIKLMSAKPKHKWWRASAS